MRTLDVPIEIEIYDGCATATPVLPAGRPATRRSRPRRAASPLARAAAHCVPLRESDNQDALAWSGALPAEVHVS